FSAGHVVVNYVEEYLDLVESLPFDLQRSVSLMKEIDANFQTKHNTHSSGILRSLSGIRVA
uniref:Inhibitor of growth protein N-terminal histone-binding domain-containing protein n=1 Tax=Astatotilapia calliptera TaxID=8154 RepID=A0A3P8NLH9_ASTCA